MKKCVYSVCVFAITALSAVSTELSITSLNATQCEGSRMPYPIPVSSVEYPDSLHPVMINHVGRHGARYPTSASKIKNITRWLAKAEAAGTLSPTGAKLLALSRYIETMAKGRWGELDSVGMAEQAGIASRMYLAYPDLFKCREVIAESSYIPRCVMSMYAFCHKLTQMDDDISITASSGPQYSKLLRPFETNAAFRRYYKVKPYGNVLDSFSDIEEPVTVAHRAVGEKFTLTHNEAVQLTADVYYMVASCAAMGIKVNVEEYFTMPEYRRMWQVDNLRQYLARTSNTLSALPSSIAGDLVENLIETTQSFINGQDTVPVHLRFGHAETILPLVSLLRLPGCYYMTNYFDTVAMHWQSYNIVPMAANLQMILFKSDTGRYYLRTELNERPVTLLPDSDAIYVPWGQARLYMTQCLPVATD